MRAVWLNRVIFFLSLAGIVVAGTLAYTSYLDVIVPCGVGEGCKDVLNHPTSKWGGIPVSYFGLGAYLALAAISVIRALKGPENTRGIGLIGYIISLIGAIVSIGLQIVSATIIHAWCPWCLTSAGIMIVMFIVQAMLFQSLAGEPVRADSGPRRKNDLGFVAIASVLGLAAMGFSGWNAANNGSRGAKFEATEADIPRLIPVDANWTGAKDAKITIVEFGDLCCPACHKAYALLKDMLRAHEGKLRVVFRHFPLFQQHKQSYRASVYAEYAASQGKFWQFLDAAYGTNPEEVDNKPNLQNLLLGLGLDVNKAEEAYGKDDSKEFERVYRDLELANNLGIKSTPTFFLVVEGEKPFSMAIGDVLRELDSNPKYRRLLGKG